MKAMFCVIPINNNLQRQPVRTSYRDNNSSLRFHPDHKFSSLLSCLIQCNNKSLSLQETARLRTRTTSTSDSLATTEVELRSVRDALERAVTDRDCLQRQAAGHLLELDRLRQVHSLWQAQLWQFLSSYQEQTLELIF